MVLLGLLVSDEYGWLSIVESTSAKHNFMDGKYTV